MTPQDIISQLLKSDAEQTQSPYAKNLELLKKIILTAHVGRLRVNGMAPDYEFVLGSYLFDNERTMFDFSRLSEEKKQDFLNWLLLDHQEEKQHTTINNVS